MKSICTLLQLLFFSVSLLIFSSTISSADNEGLIPVKVGIYDNPPKVYTNAVGEAAGIFPDILEVIAGKEGWRIEYVPGTWKECLHRLAQGEIDVMVDIAFSEEREKNMVFSRENIFLNWGSLYTGKDQVVESLLELKGKTVATVRGDIHTVGDNGIIKLGEKFELGLQFVLVDSYEEVLKLTEDGTVDAGVVNRLFGVISEDSYDINRSPVVFNSVRLKYAFSQRAVELGVPEKVDTHVLSLKRDPESVFHKIINSYLAGIEYNLEAYSELRPVKLTEEELRWLESGQTIRVGVDPGYAPYSYRDKKGDYQGLAVDKLMLVAQHLGMNIEIQEGLSWQQVMEGAKSKDLDLVLTAVETDTRLEFLNFTDVYLPTPLVIITKDSSFGIEGPEDIDGTRVALVRDYSVTERILSEYKSITPVMVDNSLAGLAAVSAGEADCYVGVLGVVDFSMREAGITNLKVAGRYDMLCNGQSVGIRKDWPILLGVLNKALHSISENRRRELHNKWIFSLSLFDGPAALQQENVLTPEETAWVRNHQKILLGADPEFAPFEFFDSDGTYQGITAEYIEILNRRLGFQMEVVPDLSWTEVIERVKTGEIDVLPIVGKTRERQEYLNFTKPYMDFHRVVITRSDAPFISSVHDIKEHNIAVQKNTSHHGFMEEMTSVAITEYPTLVAALKAVSEGKEDAFVGNLASAMYWIRKVGLTNLKVAGPVSYDTENLYFSVRKDWPELVGIIEKGLASISSSKEKQILERWIAVDYEPGLNVEEVLSYFLQAAFVVFFVLTLTLASNKRLKKEVLRREQVERDLTHKLLSEKLLSRIASNYLHLQEHKVENLLQATMGDVGELLVADSAHLLLLEEEGENAEIVYSWCSEQAADPSGTNSQVIPLKKPSLLHSEGFSNALICRQHDLQVLIDLPKTSESCPISSAKVGVVLPISRGGLPFALFCFLSDDEEVFWEADDAALLTTIGHIISNSLDKVDIDRELKEHRNLLEERIAARTAELERSNQQLTKEMVERVEAETEKETLQRQLFHTQKMESIGTLAGGIAHEFNNILTIILGNTEVTRGLSKPDSPIRINLDRILGAGGRAKKLVLQILTFSRETTSEPASINPSEVVAESMQMLRPTLPATIEIRENYGAGDSHIYVDPSQINQIIINLCTNASHAMEPEDGVLTVEIAEEQLGKEELKQEIGMVPGPYVRISVSDTGHGIDGEDVEKIFDPFYTTKNVGKGTGLGLSVVHGIVTKAGGFIQVKSSKGEGSHFHIYFPSLPATEEIPEEVSEASYSGKERILLVDDEEVIAEVNKNLIETMGYTVTTHINGREALALFESQPDSFDLVITDQTMPQITGIGFAERLLKIRPDLPVILCTGYSSLIDQEKAEKVGIRGFILKPFSRQEIGELIRSLCDTVE